MHSFFRDYRWIKGKPVGIDRVSEGTFRIVTDSYHKRYSIETYDRGRFVGTNYDSLLLDFRNLKPFHQIGWRKESVSENSALIFDENDRLILKEESHFEHDRCRSCNTYSVHGPLVSTLHLYYKDFDDPFDGTTLFDANERPVWIQKYEGWDEGAFFNLTEDDRAPSNNYRTLSLS